MASAREVADEAARRSYGKLLAYLASLARDVSVAEDALSAAFETALTAWVDKGIPDNPEAWLLTTARRNLHHVWRHARVREAALPVLGLIEEERADEGKETFPDERLKLLFICAHPAIDEAARTPLMLQTVLGLDAARIASAFVVAPATMGQRLVRAKAKIREAQIAFAVPDAADLPERLEFVLQAIYAAFNAAWDGSAAASLPGPGLTDEAIWLARLVVSLLPNEPEPKGLLALMLYCESRRSARRGAAGSYIPLQEQDPGQWNKALIAEAEVLLRRARDANRLGRFQLEAAIQSVYAGRASSNRTDWYGLALLYEGLVRMAPAIGALVGRAAAIAELRGAATGLAHLDQLPDDQVASYQPYWATRAHLLDRLGQPGEAQHAYQLAIGLSEDPSVREFLIRKSAKPSAM